MTELTNIAKAIIAVMKAIKGIDKSMTVGSGTMSYKGVSDQVVKQTIGEEMEKNGLCIIPIGVEAKNQIDRWEETNQYGVKQKQSVFVEVVTKYLLLHESGESIEVAGYGHGTDPQDKAAGKATTYALKYALLYTFMVATGKIDDTDNEHSDDKQVAPPVKAAEPAQSEDNRAWLSDKQLDTVVLRLQNGEKEIYQKTLDGFKVNKAHREKLKAEHDKIK